MRSGRTGAGHAAAVRTSRYGGRQRRGRPAHSAHRWRPAVRPRLIRHEGWPRRRPRRLPRRRQRHHRRGRRRRCRRRGTFQLQRPAGADATSADAAIVTEPTELAVATAHKGFVWTEIHVTGKAAHGFRYTSESMPFSRPDPSWSRSRTSTGGCAEGNMTLGPGNLHASLIAGGLEGIHHPGHMRTHCRTPHPCPVRPPPTSKPTSPCCSPTAGTRRPRPCLVQSHHTGPRPVRDRLRRRSSSERSATPPPMSSVGPLPSWG